MQLFDFASALLLFLGFSHVPVVVAVVVFLNSLVSSLGVGGQHVFNPSASVSVAKVYLEKFAN